MAKVNSFNDVIDSLTFAVVKVDQQHCILGYNARFFEWFGGDSKSLIGQDFYKTLGNPFFFEGDYAPFYFAQNGKTTRTIIGEHKIDISQRPAGFEPKLSSCSRIFSMLVTEQKDQNAQTFFLVELQDRSQTSKLDRQIESLQRAGQELTAEFDSALSSDQLLSDKDRIARLSQQIQTHMERTLDYNVFEIRVLESDNDKNLHHLLGLGIDEDAVCRDLIVSSIDNGITGYVADTGVPYRCDYTKDDKHYIVGAINALSSLTVPLLFGNKVIGVCNVESEEAHHFTKRDEVFLQLYCQYLATAIHLHQSISTHIRQLQGQFENGLLSDMSNLLEQIYSLNFDESNIDQIRRLVSCIQEFRNNISTEPKRLTNEEEEQFSKEFPLAYELFSEQPKRILFVSSNDETNAKLAPRDTVRLLESFGCNVDVVYSTRAALGAVKVVTYDIILTDKNPDGVYFTSFESNACTDLFSLYQIHHSKYLEPLGDCDEETRREFKRVQDEILSGKLDAFFLEKKIRELNLPKSPLVVVYINDRFNTHDSTHILTSLTEELQQRAKELQQRANENKIVTEGPPQFPHFRSVEDRNEFVKEFFNVVNKALKLRNLGLI